MRSLNPSRKYAEVYLSILFFAVFSIGKELIDSSDDMSLQSVFIAITIAAIFMLAGIASAVSGLRSDLAKKDSEILALKSQIESLKKIESSINK